MTGLKRLFFLTLVMLFLISHAVHAESIHVKVFSIQNSILLGQSAAFDVKITNNQSIYDNFRISSPDGPWSLSSDPLNHYFTGIDIPSMSSETVRLIVAPLGNISSGRYKIELVVRSRIGNDTQGFPLYVSIEPENPLIQEYLTAVHRLVEIPSVVIPDKNVAVKINIVNRNPKNISNISLVMSSRLNLNRTFSTSLEPLEQKHIQELFSLDPMTLPQKDVLTVQFFVDGIALNPVVREPYEIGAYSEIVKESSETSDFFLRFAEKATYNNVGNVKNSKRIEIPTNKFESLFTKSTPDKVMISRNGHEYLIWELSLEPGERTTVTRTVSYLPLVIIVFVLLAGGFLYYLMRSPVHVIKRASVIHLSNGGISELKVIVHLKNRSGEHFEKFTITDKIPIIADVKSDHDVGSIKPTSIFTHGSQTTVKWEIHNLEKSEERILSYKLKSKLPIFGDVVLPGVSVRFYSKKGVKLLTKSKYVTVKP